MPTDYSRQVCSGRAMMHRQLSAEAAAHHHHQHQQLLQQAIAYATVRQSAVHSSAASFSAIPNSPSNHGTSAPWPATCP